MGDRVAVRASDGAPPGAEDAGVAPEADADALVTGEVLVEELSIDGMCGVY